MIYLLIILISMILIAVFNIFVSAPMFSMSVWDIVFAVIISTISVIIIDLIFAFIVRRLLPKKWFSVDKKCFVASRKTCILYEKLGIKKWKDKVIELGCLTNFRKNKISEPTNNEYISRYIKEANYGIVIHIVDIIIGFFVIFIYPLKVWWCFGLPVAIVNAFLNLLPFMILRYNLRKLHTLYKFNLRRNNTLSDSKTSDSKTRDNSEKSEESEEKSPD